MYASGELRIRPEYQRLFRWSIEKQSRFIESLLLEMPIPPIFALEIEEGKWELIDGLQRISTYLHFRGMLNATELDPPIRLGDSLELDDCDIIKELNGLNYEKLPTALQIRLKRAFMNVQLVRKDTDTRFRYYMFKRLNTGGESLSDQEIRNCTIRLLGDEFNSFLQELANEAVYKNCIASITEDKRRQMYDVELVLRFFAFKNNFDKFRHDIAEFLTTYMEAVTEKQVAFDYAAERVAFISTFTFLSDGLGENTCLRWGGNGFIGGFANHHFEAFALGAAKVVPEMSATNNAQASRLKNKLIELKKSTALKDLTTGGGKNSPGPYKAKIMLVAEGLRESL